MQRKVEEVNKLIKIANNHDQFSPSLNNGAIEEINNYTILFFKRYIVVVAVVSFFLSAIEADPFFSLPRRV